MGVGSPSTVAPDAHMGQKRFLLTNESPYLGNGKDRDMRKENTNSYYVLYQMVTLQMTLSDLNDHRSPPFLQLSPVFEHLPEPNRACLVGVYAVTLDPLLSLYGIIYVTWYTRLLPKATRVRFR